MDDIASGIGQAILESLGDSMGDVLNESLDEVAVKGAGAGTVQESFGSPKVNKNETISVPAVIACIVETDDADPTMGGRFEKIDQGFLDKNRDLILQKLILEMNRDHGIGYGFRSMSSSIFFDPENFKLEYVDGGVVRLTTTIIIDLRPTLSSIRGVRWRLEGAISDTAQKMSR